MTPANWDDPQQLGAFLDAVRWGTVASADTRTLQAPFRSGITIEEYQLEPVARALAMPRVNLLTADDVGLGKTIEAGLVVQEMLLRHRARRVIVVCPASLTLKWREEMESKFGLGFTIVDTAQLRELRRSHGLEANPFAVYPRTIISLQWLRTPRVQRMLDEVLTNESRFPGFFDLLIVDEVHHCAPAEPPKPAGYPVESKQTQAVRRLTEHSQHHLFLSAPRTTAASDSEGTLGGLVALGERRYLERILRQALDDASHCSSDPLCAEHIPEYPSAVLHNAACHACLFASETSCEAGNRWLDRAVLVDLTGDGFAFPLR